MAINNERHHPPTPHPKTIFFLSRQQRTSSQKYFLNSKFRALFVKQISWNIARNIGRRGWSSQEPCFALEKGARKERALFVKNKKLKHSAKHWQAWVFAEKHAVWVGSKANPSGYIYIYTYEVYKRKGKIEKQSPDAHTIFWKHRPSHKMAGRWTAQKSGKQWPNTSFDTLRNHETSANLQKEELARMIRSCSPDVGQVLFTQIHSPGFYGQTAQEARGQQTALRAVGFQSLTGASWPQQQPINQPTNQPTNQTNKQEHQQPTPTTNNNNQHQQPTPTPPPPPPPPTTTTTKKNRKTVGCICEFDVVWCFFAGMPKICSLLSKTTRIINTAVSTQNSLVSKG